MVDAKGRSSTTSLPALPVPARSSSASRPGRVRGTGALLTQASCSRGYKGRVATPLTRRIALDTLYSLLADADFEKEQAAIDASVASVVSERPAAA